MKMVDVMKMQWRVRVDGIINKFVGAVNRRSRRHYKLVLDFSQCWRSISDFRFWIVIFPIFRRSRPRFIFPDSRFWTEIEIDRWTMASLAIFLSLPRQRLTLPQQRAHASVTAGHTADNRPYLVHHKRKQLPIARNFGTTSLEIV